MRKQTVPSVKKYCQEKLSKKKILFFFLLAIILTRFSDWSPGAGCLNLGNWELAGEEI